MSAAVADYKISKSYNQKIKSDNKEIVLSLTKNPDIITNISKNIDAKIIGFALETENGTEEALKKLKNKNLDFIILNYANEEGAGFDVNTNHVYIFSKDGQKKELKLNRKDRIAKSIIEYVSSK